jgi:hypothetical protein
MVGFIVTFPSSLGDPCFLVHPGRIGQPVTSRYPWGRATFVATVFATQEAAQAALDEMVRIHSYIAPELNGGLTKRLHQARVIPAGQVTGIELS